MKLRTLMVLVVVLVILAVVAGVRLRKPAGRAAEGPVPGAAVLAGLDINQVSKLTVVSGVSTSLVEKKDGRWIVSSLYGYPADFDRLAQQLRSLVDLKVGQIMRGGTDNLDEFGLSASNATHVLLKDAADKTLADLFIGMPRLAENGQPYGNGPGGQYLRVGSGPVLLVSDMVRGFSPSGADWARRELFSVNPREVKTLTLGSPAGELNIRTTGPGTYTLDGQATNEIVEPPVAGRLFAALHSLTFVTVADPAATNQITGLDKPRRFTAKTTNGFYYSVLTGEADVSQGLFARVRVEYQPPAPPTTDEVKASLPPPKDTDATSNREAQVKQEFDVRMAAYNKKVTDDQQLAQDLDASLRKWTYVLSATDCANLTIDRNQLVKKIEPPTPTQSVKPPKAPEGEEPAAETQATPAEK